MNHAKDRTNSPDASDIFPDDPPDDFLIELIGSGRLQEDRRGTLNQAAIRAAQEFAATHGCGDEWKAPILVVMDVDER